MNELYLKYEFIQSIDVSKLDQLVTLGRDLDEDVIGQLLKIHYESAETSLSEMKKFLNAKNFLELKRSVHKFKSSCANLGLMKLHKICNDFETVLADSIHQNIFDQSLHKNFLDCIEHEERKTHQTLVNFQKAA